MKGKRAMNKVLVNFIFRKSQDNYFSIENTFKNIISALPANIVSTETFLPYYSRGILPRIKNVLFCRTLDKDKINHITGDVHFLGIFFSPGNTVLTVHDCVFLNKKGFLGKFLIWLFWYYWPVRRLKYITTISEFTKTQLVSVTKVNPDKIKVIHNPIRPDFFYVEKEFNTNCPVILHVGTSQNKNLINVSKSLKGITCHLWVVGKLSRTQELQLQSDQINYSNYVNLSDTEMREAYAGCDIVMFASLYEGFGLPVIEAQVTGRVVITSRLASLPEVAGDGAFYVNPLDVEDISKTVKEVIQNDEKRNATIKAGMLNSHRFAQDKIASEYAELYKTVKRCAV